MTERQTVDLEHGFVLHQRPYGNTSQLIEYLSAGYGRVGLVARGSRRRPRGQRALLQPFIPLRVSWIRRGELGRLIDVDAVSAALPLSGNALLSAFYANELILRLTARDDPNAEAFAAYGACLQSLASDAGVSRALRIFELGLLRALGFGPELEVEEATHEPIVAERSYAFEAHTGPHRLEAHRPDAFRGSELIALREQNLDDAGHLRAARRILSVALEPHLEGRPLKTRQVLYEIVEKGLER
jgi:DNA repair protein RecO (recombination protein O)